MKLIVGHTERKGRGVYALERASRGALIMCNPALVFPHRDARIRGRVHDYTFQWKRGLSAIALGLGSLLNHSPRPNCIYLLDHEEQTIIFQAACTIRRGDELTIDYGAPTRFRVVE